MMQGAATVDPAKAPSTLLSMSAREAPGVLALAFPIVAGLTASTLIGVVDTIMIAPLGADALAAASLAASAAIIMYAATYGLIAVTHVRFAQANGAKDAPAMAHALRNGLALAVIVGAVCTGIMLAGFPLLAHLNLPAEVLSALFPYWIAKSFILVPYALLSTFRGLFNAVNRPWASTAIAMFAVVVNIPLNYVLINGAFGASGLGLLGAGLGSLIAQCVALAAAYAYWRVARVFQDYRIAATLSPRRILGAFKDGLPVALGNLGEGGGYALAGLMLGFFGAAALAANQVVHSIAAIMYMLPVGMTSAVAIRIGQAAGAGETSRLRPIGLSATGIALVWMLCFLIALVLFRGDIARALSDDPEVIALAVTLFMTVGFTQFADGLQSASLGALRGLVDVRTPTVITLVAYWVIGLPAAYALGFRMGWGPNGVWIGYGLGVLLAAAALQFRFWMKTAPGRDVRPQQSGAAS